MFKNQTTSIWNSIDWLTVGLYAILIIMGWFNIYAAVYDEEHQSIFDITQRYGKQMLWIIASIVLIVAVMLIDPKVYVFFSYPIYVTTILLLISVLFFGVEINGAKSWFEIGSIRIQPAEFAKFATILAIANYLSDLNRKLLTFRSLLTVALLIIIPAGMILLQNDTGSTLVFAALIFMLYREGLPGWILLVLLLAILLFYLVLTKPFYWVIILVNIICFGYAIYRHPIKKTILIFGGVLSAIFVVLVLINSIADLNFEVHQIMLGTLTVSFPIIAYYSFLKKVPYLTYIWIVAMFLIGFAYSTNYFYDNALREHQRNRIDHIFGIHFDPLGAGYNVNQSKIAIGSGGLIGKGFLQGTQTKYDFVPEQSTDFIFCTIGEEWGFVGSSVVILLFLALMLRLIYLAERQESKFSRIYGYGVFSIIFFHVAVNIGMTIGIAPVIGIPLPFFSYGGSSLWGFTILLFVFLKFDTLRNQRVK